MKKTPHFAVVGHPNKGKSSLVATLALDESVTIGELPGTTSECSYFPLRVDNEILYTLIDTPGFQRPRQLLALLKEQNPSAAERSATLTKLISTLAAQAQFPDETKLLQPIIDGAGILYVVDGSVPYSSEYEPEMEILRWTGQPRMAIINPISANHFVADWNAALAQFFSIVKVVNATSATFEKRLDLLYAFAELNADWKPHLVQAAKALQISYQQKRRQSARDIASMLLEALACKVETTLAPHQSSDEAQEKLKTKLLNQIQTIETETRANICALYDQRKLEIEDSQLSILNSSVLSESSLRIFGISKYQLLSLGGLTGAATGGGLDLVLGGSSFFLGSLVGAGLVATATLIGSKKFFNLKVINIPLGRKRVTLKLAHNNNLAFVLLGRARLHRKIVAQRAHGARWSVNLEHISESTPLTGEHFSKLGKIFLKAFKAANSEALRNELELLLENIFIADDNNSSSNSPSNSSSTQTLGAIPRSNR